ncbi:MAG: hypothetical protein HQL32_17390, partial [Planctomycetes bacterium]|nr:hypothetical protein [Planctomycetota bacterium]
MRLTWCVDHNTALTGTVGTIEAPGERHPDFPALIKPGGTLGDEALWSSSDGVLQPAIAGTPENVFLASALNPGLQKWRPQYRFGTIQSINDQQ